MNTILLPVVLVCLLCSCAVIKNVTTKFALNVFCSFSVDHFVIWLNNGESQRSDPLNRLAAHLRDMSCTFCKPILQHPTCKHFTSYFLLFNKVAEQNKNLMKCNFPRFLHWNVNQSIIINYINIVK